MEGKTGKHGSIQGTAAMLEVLPPPHRLMGNVQSPCELGGRRRQQTSVNNAVNEWMVDDGLPRGGRESNSNMQAPYQTTYTSANP